MPAGTGGMSSSRVAPTEKKSWGSECNLLHLHLARSGRHRYRVGYKGVYKDWMYTDLNLQIWYTSADLNLQICCILLGRMA